MTDRVKALEWEDFGDRAAKANAMLLTNYLIDMWSDGRFEVSVSSPGYGTGFDGERWHGSMNEAKAAVQADYEARILAALEPVTVQEAARNEALIALDQLEAVEDAYTRWMLANATGDPDLVHRDGNKLSKALFAMLNDGPDDGPSTILRALRALAERGE